MLDKKKHFQASWFVSHSGHFIYSVLGIVDLNVYQASVACSLFENVNDKTTVVVVVVLLFCVHGKHLRLCRDSQLT